MKSADIKIGEQYQVGYYGCGKVLETRVERTSWRGGPARKDGVKVIFETGHRQGQEMLVSSREVNQLWSEHQAVVDARELQRKIAEQDNERVRLKTDQLSEALTALGVETGAVTTTCYWGANNDYRGQINFSEEALDRLIEILDAPEASEKAASIETGDPLAELLV